MLAFGSAGKPARNVRLGAVLVFHITRVMTPVGIYPRR